MIVLNVTTMIVIVTSKSLNNRNVTVSVLVKLLPYLINSLGLRAVFIFHGLAPSFYHYLCFATCITLKYERFPCPILLIPHSLLCDICIFYPIDLHPGVCAPLVHFLFGSLCPRPAGKPFPSSLPSSRRIFIQILIAECNIK